MARSYCLITPCRDEAAYARRSLDSVVSQTLEPALWVIVDDGSTDETPQILAEYADKYPYIRIVRRDDRGRRSVGPGVIDAFYVGFDEIDPAQFDYVCKLDLDLDLPAGYFEELVREMEQNPRLGTCSGKPYAESVAGELTPEPSGDEMSAGMTKFYRTQCFQEIGGFVREVMWDGIDCHRCRMLGWIARSWDRPELRFVHLRPMGSSYKGILTGRKRHGFGQYFMGTSFPYMCASALYRMRSSPLIVGGVAMLWGYVLSALRQKKRYDDLEFRRFLRSYQWRVLVAGKRRATEEFEERGLETWCAAHANVHVCASADSQ